MQAPHRREEAWPDLMVCYVGEEVPWVVDHSQSGGPRKDQVSENVEGKQRR
jgi:hypothetical protein